MSSPNGHKGGGGPVRRLVWFSEIQWDFLSTRKQRLLSRFPAPWRILFIEPFALGRPNHWLPVRRGRVWVVGIPFLKNGPEWIGRLLAHRPLRVLAETPGFLLAAFWVLLLGFGRRERLIGLSNPYWGRAALAFRARLRFYDANDDHLAFPGVPSWLPAYQQRWLERTGLVFSVDEELSRRLPLRSGTRIVSLGNGVEYERFAVPAGAPSSRMAAPGVPVLGYAGAMDWIDTDLVARTARAWPAFQIVLVGPAYAHGWWERQEELQQLSNVSYVGRVDYAELPGWIAGFDLALMPIPPGRLKGVSHPNKLYEYAAAGVPVLALNYCGAVERARELITVAESAEAFIRLVPEAMADRRSRARQEFARGHSWDLLASTMVGELERSLGEGRR